MKLKLISKWNGNYISKNVVISCMISKNHLTVYFKNRKTIKDSKKKILADINVVKLMKVPIFQMSKIHRNIRKTFEVLK